MVDQSRFPVIIKIQTSKLWRFGGSLSSLGRSVEKPLNNRSTTETLVLWTQTKNLRCELFTHYNIKGMVKTKA